MTCASLNFQQFFFVQALSAVLSDRFKSTHYGEVLRVVMTRLDRAAIDKDRGKVKPRDGHHCAGHVLVTATDRE